MTIRWHKVNNRAKGYPPGTIHWVGWTGGENDSDFRVEVRRKEGEKVFTFRMRRQEPRMGRIHRGEFKSLQTAQDHAEQLLDLSQNHPDQFGPVKVSWHIEKPGWHPEDEWSFAGYAETQHYEALLYEAWHSSASARESCLWSWRALFVDKEEGYPFRELNGNGLVKRCKNQVREVLQELG